MKHNILIRFVTALAAMLLLYACTNEELEKEQGHKRLVLNCSFTGFDGSSTRAGEYENGIYDGARMYLDFDGFKTYATYDEDSGEWLLDDCPDDAGGAVTAYFPNMLTYASSPFQGTGSYSNTYDAMTVNVTLKPLTGRIRFRGEPGKAVVVSGLRYYSSFSQSTYQFSTSTSSRSLTIVSDGYTPYVYATFADKTELSITYDGDTYSKTFSSNVLQAGKSGYIDLKSHEIEIIPEFSIEGYGNDETIQPQNHEYVDLGLSVKWATCNVGASSPEDYGDYYAWGETETKSSYNWSTYKWCKGSSYTMTKYCTDSYYGTVDNKTVLDPEDDVAHAKWGGSWRMPTRAELDELREKCTWTWKTQNGKNGYKVTSKSNGNSIFLPAAGYRYDSSLGYAGSDGFYWPSSLHDYIDFGAYVLDFGSSYVDWYGSDRCNGRSVRPVWSE